jgi:hypothetical protein
MDPNPIYTIFLPSSLALSMNSMSPSGGLHFLLAESSGSSRNQYPVMRIHSYQSSGGGTTVGLKLYRKGTLCCASLSMLVDPMPIVRFRQRLICEEMARQKTWSNYSRRER